MQWLTCDFEDLANHAFWRERIFKDRSDLLGEWLTSHAIFFTLLYFTSDPTELTASVTFSNAARFILFEMPPALSEHLFSSLSLPL